MFFPVLSRRSLMAGSLSTLALLTTGESVSAQSTSVVATPSFTSDPLPSWVPGVTKRSIIIFVTAVSRPGHDFVPPEERIAVFDNDGTLWAEQPMYFQLVFALDRVAELVKANPALRDKPAFAAMADKDMAAITALSEADLMTAALATQDGLEPEEYQSIVRTWLEQARHPSFKAPYPSLVYQPQLELLAYLRANGFKTYIVSGGEVQFMRAFAQEVYGIPPEQVIGTSQKAEYELRAGRGVVLARPELNNIDDGPGKPVNIALHIGRRPLVAVGNSDGDQQMLEYASTPERPGLQILIHHDDAEREYAYDRQSKIGKLDKALDEAGGRGWVVVSMKNDWKTVFP
jgi:phosphoglycolate phosphatase-like HAD superfamily hydrolase